MQDRLDQLWDWDDPAGSEVRLRDAAKAASNERGRDILLTQVARALGLQRRFAEATTLLDSLPAGTDPELDARISLERGRVLNSGGAPQDARAHFEAALARAEAFGLQQLAVDAVHMQAIVASPTDQVALNEKAIAMAEAATDPRARQWLASLYNNLAWARMDAGQPDAALRLFELALAERRTRDSPRETAIARWAVARAKRAVGRVDEALAEQRQLAADNAASGAEDPYVDEEIGECLLALGQLDEARPHFGSAARRLAADAWFVENEAKRLQRLRELGGEELAS